MHVIQILVAMADRVFLQTHITDSRANVSSPITEGTVTVNFYINFVYNEFYIDIRFLSLICSHCLVQCNFHS